jgi:hypothetical protein
MYSWWSEEISMSNKQLQEKYRDQILFHINSVYVLATCLFKHKEHPSKADVFNFKFTSKQILSNRQMYLNVHVALWTVQI